MHILLLGGSGFVSGRILHVAIEAGHTVTFVTRGSKRVRETDQARHVRADRDRDDLVRMLADSRYDVVVDAICRAPEHAHQAVALARRCRRLIMVSTDYVYDPRHRRLPQSEDDAVFSERDDYGGDKRRAETVILGSGDADHVEATIVRPPHVYGPGSLPGTIPRHGRTAKLLDDIVQGMPLSLLQGGLGLIQPIHVDDLARILLALIDKSETLNEAINCAGPDLMTHADYYTEIARCVGRPVTIVPYFPTGAEAVNAYVSGHRYYDVSKLNRSLPGFPYTPFGAGIADWVGRLKENRRREPATERFH